MFFFACFFVLLLLLLLFCLFVFLFVFFVVFFGGGGLATNQTTFLLTQCNPCHSSCWMSLPVLRYGFALPVGFILAANLILFARITISLFRRKDMSKHSSKKTNQTAVNIRASFISFCMLGTFICFSPLSATEVLSFKP